MASITVRAALPSLGGGRGVKLFPNGPRLLDGWGRRAVTEVQRRWGTAAGGGGFIHDTGKSRKAFYHEVDAARLGLRVLNNATNKYGDNYAKYVHLSGRKELLVDVMARYLDAVIAPMILDALSRDHLASRSVKTPSKVYK